MSMINGEPFIRVGIVEDTKRISGEFRGVFTTYGETFSHSTFRITVREGKIYMLDGEGSITVAHKTLTLRGENDAFFSLNDVALGKIYSDTERAVQVFPGNMIVELGEGETLRLVNELPLERYLTFVVASEMNPMAPEEFLKAQAIVARSWILAGMINKKEKGNVINDRRETGAEIIRWYDREDHRHFHVCADDHCQRYRGVPLKGVDRAQAAVESTRGFVICYGDDICDARFHKVCGGITEDYGNVWAPIKVPYLRAISDGKREFPFCSDEDTAKAWMFSTPPAYCNVEERGLLEEVLPPSDLRVHRTFRWRVDYEREQLEDIIFRKSGIDFGVLKEIKPLERGPSGRIVRLRVVGSKRSAVVGKELEIRRWLAETSLLSSAFVVMVDRDGQGIPHHFTFYGAGWGHGVGLCQVGAASMARMGFSAEEILKHYFRGAQLKRLYP